jgi:hypothetical protein
MPSLQFGLIIIIELANMLLILESMTPLEVIGNFILLSILAEFDTMIYASCGSQNLKKLFYEEIRDLVLIVQHTSSSQCDGTIMTDILDEKGKPRPMKITIKQRIGVNLIYYAWYKSSKMFYVLVYYYFFPLFAIIASLKAPKLLIVNWKLVTKEQAEAAGAGEGGH